MRVTLLALLAVRCACLCAEPQLQLAISKRVPSCADTVQFSAHLDNWQRPASGSSVLFAVESAGGTKAIGKAIIATDAAKPFEPSVRWAPGAPGLYRITARVEGTPLFVRVLVPVVAPDVFFCWHGETRPEVEWITHSLSAGESEIAALHGRGIVALKHVGGVSYLGGPRPEDIKTDVDLSALAPRILKDYTETAPWDGIAIDELGMWDQHPEQTRLALGFGDILKQARAARPNSFFATWQFGALTPLECNLFRDSMDLVMCEVYQNYFRAWYDQHTFYEYLRQRIDVARAMQVIKKTVIGLSISTDYGGSTPEELEDQIRQIRLLGPEMRGVAFFSTSRSTREVIERASDCCYRYWVKPVVGLLSEADLTVSDYIPSDGGVVQITATVHNIGGMDAENVRVQFWDGDPARGGSAVGDARVIRRLPAARWVDPQARDDKSIDPPDKMRREGFGMASVSVQWEARRGAHELWAEILPDPQYTTLRAYQSKRLRVR